MSDMLLLHRRDGYVSEENAIPIGEQACTASYAHCIIRMLNKSVFEDDSAFEAVDDSGEFLTGVILNSRTLLMKNGLSNIASLLKVLATTEEKSPYMCFEGSYIGVSVSNNGANVIVYTDCLGNYPLYYYHDASWTIASNKIGLVVEQMKALGLTVRPDKVGVYSLLTYAYMLGDHTLIEGVSRVPVGCHLAVDNNDSCIVRHYDIPEQSVCDDSDDIIIERIDSLFLDAIRAQSSKNDEYGLPNYTALSAGLDSRMTFFALERIGARQIIAFTYSESGQHDQKIPERIIHDYRCDWLFKSLDSASDITKIEEGISRSDFRVYYPWAAQLDGFLRLVNTGNMGLVHTGVIGDVVIGTFCHRRDELDRSYKLCDGAYSSVLKSRLNELVSTEIQEEPYATGMMRNRGFNGACLGYSTTFQEYTEALSPFMYRPLFDYCMRLPDILRFRHSIYYQWVRRFYPEASRYPHNGISIRFGGPSISLFGKEAPLTSIPSLVREKALARIDRRKGMNPVQYWYDNMPEVRVALDQYFLNHIDIIDESVLKSDLTKLYNQSAIDKTLVLSLLGYYECLFTKTVVNK